MNKNILLVAIFIAAIIVSCNDDPEVLGLLDITLQERIGSSSPTGNLDYFIMPDAGDLGAIPNQDPQNPITAEKIALGQQLFFETGLAQHPKEIAAYETFSCSTCHVPNSGFLPGRIQGVADGGFGFGKDGATRTLMFNYEESEIDAQGIRPLTVMNVAYMTNTLWSGTFGANDRNVGTEAAWTGTAEINHTGLFGIEAQNIEGFELHRMDINDRVLFELGYSDLFDQAFPDLPIEERYSVKSASFALASFLRSLLTNQAPFQEYLRGETAALSESEKRGASLFFGEAHCVSCHAGPSFSNMKFYSIGTKDLIDAGGLNTSANEPRSLGRAAFTKKDSDKYAFKVPQLYNLKDYATFFHGSSKNSIEEVVDYKIKAVAENENVEPERVPLQPLTLSDFEKADLINFLTNALYDENMDRYVPDAVLSGNCFPNNDVLSRFQIGCD